MHCKSLASEKSFPPSILTLFDSSDPHGMVDIVGALYTVPSFYESLFNGLADDGILVAQVGEAPDTSSPSDDFSIDCHLAGFIRGLADVGFDGIRLYQEVSQG